MWLENIDESEALVRDILSVMKDPEKASLRAIKEFAPYINEKDRPLPFLCKTIDDFSLPINVDEYQIFLKNLDKRFYPSYFTPKMDVSKAVSVLCNCITSGNYVADDYAQFSITRYNHDFDNKRFAESLSVSISKMEAKLDSTSVKRTRGGSSYYAYQLYDSLKKKIGLRSPTLYLS